MACARDAELAWLPMFPLLSTVRAGNPAVLPMRPLPLSAGAVLLSRCRQDTFTALAKGSASQRCWPAAADAADRRAASVAWPPAAASPSVRVALGGSCCAATNLTSTIPSSAHRALPHPSNAARASCSCFVGAIQRACVCMSDMNNETCVGEGGNQLTGINALVSVLSAAHPCTHAPANPA